MEAGLFGLNLTEDIVFEGICSRAVQIKPKEPKRIHLVQN